MRTVRTVGLASPRGMAHTQKNSQVLQLSPPWETLLATYQHDMNRHGFELDLVRREMLVLSRLNGLTSVRDRFSYHFWDDISRIRALAQDAMFAMDQNLLGKPLYRFSVWMSTEKATRTSVTTSEKKVDGMVAVVRGPANLDDVNLEGMHLVNANLTGASLKRANLKSADLSLANLQGADLEDADLGCANLCGTNLIGAKLRHADLVNARLERAKLRAANLVEATFQDANLSGASLVGANLSGASLEGANLEGATVDGAILNGTNLGGARLKAATLQGTDLRGALNLSSVDFQRASLIAVCLQQSNLSSHVNAEFVLGTRGKMHRLPVLAHAGKMTSLPLETTGHGSGMLKGDGIETAQRDTGNAHCSSTRVPSRPGTSHASYGSPARHRLCWQ